MTKKTFLHFDQIDWAGLQADVDERIDMGQDLVEAIRAELEERAAALDDLVDFDALINGKAEFIGDGLEVADGYLFAGALRLLKLLAIDPQARRGRRLARLRARLAGEKDHVRQRVLRYRIEVIEKRIAEHAP